MTYNDPAILHAGECNTCHATFRDADVLNDNGDCPECQEAFDAEREGEEANNKANGTDWFSVAADILGVRK